MTAHARTPPALSLALALKLGLTVGLASTLPLAQAQAQAPTPSSASPAPTNAAAPVRAAARWSFSFGSGPLAAGQQRVTPQTRWAPDHAGFDAPGGAVPALPLATVAAVAGPQAGHAVLAPAAPAFFSLDLPEGRYRVTLTLGGSAEASDTTVRGEVRRLLLQNVRTAPRQVVQAQFAVHVRTPQIAARAGQTEGTVQLRGTREAVNEGWNWDGRLTLEFNGARPVVQALTVERVDGPTLFLLGDSTVADQPEEPYASWGQQLPRWFGEGVAVASLAQSGETYRDALNRRRVDKILTLARPGDTVLMQYGHNDQKQLRDGSGSLQTYREEIRTSVRRLREQQLQPVLVTSVERRFFEADGSLRRTLADQVDAVRELGRELGVPVLDLNERSRALYLALGPQRALEAFGLQADGRIDPTHHNGYGAWLLAGLVAQELKALKLPVADGLRADAPVVDVAAPATPTRVGLHPSPQVARQRPPGDGDAARPAAPSAPAAAAPLRAGFSPERLARLDRAIDDEIAAGRLAGGATLLLRDGQVVHRREHGHANREDGEAIKPDTLYRIASMSKAVTTVAALMFYEEGRFLLKDPISKWLPAFAQPQVAVAGEPGQPPRLEKARRPITVRDLLLHTAGLSYGAGPAEAEWKREGFSDWYVLGRDETLAQWTDRLARLPLQAHPGETWQYGYSTDVLGRLVEIWCGQPLDRCIAERITGPLKMADTHFFVPPEKVSRLARVYGLEGGRLVLKETAARSDFVNGPRRLFSGGAGLVSTAGDYGRFLQMLLNRGELDGVRLLSPATVALMQRDHVSGRYTGYGGDGEGSGFGFWLQTNPGSRSELGDPGSYGWGSAYVPQYLVNPEKKLVFLFMAQLRPAGDSTLNQRVKVLMRQALME